MPHCFDKVDESQRQRFQEREKLVQLAKQRGEEHIGSIANDISSERRRLNYLDKERARNSLNN